MEVSKKLTFTIVIFFFLYFVIFFVFVFFVAFSGMIFGKFTGERSFFRFLRGNKSHNLGKCTLSRYTNVAIPNSVHFSSRVQETSNG